MHMLRVRNEPTEREAKGRMLNETQIDELIAHGIDYCGGVDRFGGNSAMFEKFIFRYLDDEHYSLLVAAVEAGDAEEGFRVAHTLKGVVGNLSFSSYFAVLDPVTESLRSGDLESARRLMPNVEKAHMETIAILEQLS